MFLSCENNDHIQEQCNVRSLQQLNKQFGPFSMTIETFPIYELFVNASLCIYIYFEYF